MHFLTIVLIPQTVPQEDGALYAALEQLIKPYDSNIEGPMRKEYYTARAIQKLAASYCVRATNLPKIAAKLRKDLGVVCGADEKGLYYFTKLNPAGKYDYWTLHPIAEHGWLVRDMPRDLLPSAVVTPDGRWHDTGEEKWDKDLTAAEREVIRERVYALVDQYPGHRAIPLDCHQ
jgi:hypothetical protein